MVPTTVLAYQAGVVDSDGYIGICKNSQKPSRCWNPRYQGEIVVTNTFLPLLTWIHSYWGGSIRQRRKVAEHHKTTYSWKIGDKQAAAFAEAIHPYLMVKGGQAADLLDLQAAKARPNPHGKGARLTPEKLAEYEALYQRFKARNDDRRPQRLSERAPDAQ